ncbi:uncharacterized protein LOC142326328 [Lycorma delicatula]|uniref:uncharacterized protein LOC142326328 n=1 Tax=Lycorma delicatula TaxID=130591 RepID=UPI003F517F66
MYFQDQETDFNDKFNLDKNKSNNVQDPKEKHTVYPHNPVDLPSCSYQTSARHRASEVKLETNQPYKVHSSCKLKVNDTAKTVLGESGSKKNILLPATTKSHNSPITAKPQTNQTRETQFIFHDPKKSAFSQVCDTFVTICCMIVDGIVLMKLICGDDIINKDTLWDVVDILHPKDNSCSFNIIEPEID